MAIPTFQDLTLPVLRLAADEKEHSVQESCLALEKEFKLTKDEVNELLPSQRQSRFRNRVAWAVTYLKASLLLEGTGRGRFKVSDRGKSVLAKPPPRIDIAFLMQFPEIREFRSGGKGANKPKAAVEDVGEKETPEEAMESGANQHKKRVALDLLQKVRACSDRAFETLVVNVLVRMGYGGSLADAGQVVGRAGDGGIDGIIKQDKLGLEEIYVQAKRWKGSVGEPVARDFAGSLEGKRAHKGVLITTSSFTAETRAYVGKIGKKIILIDGETLAQHMIDHEVGVTKGMAFYLYELDGDYFEELQ